MLVSLDVYSGTITAHYNNYTKLDQVNWHNLSISNVHHLTQPPNCWDRLETKQMSVQPRFALNVLVLQPVSDQPHHVLHNKPC